jgi:hypothetical protein
VHRARSPRPVPPTIAAAPTPTCRGRLSVPVVVDPAILVPVQAVADKWNSTSPAVDDRCVSVQVGAVPSGVEAATLSGAGAGTQPPALWVPDSRIWAERLSMRSGNAGALKVDVGDSVACSPLVVAAPPGPAVALAPAVKAGGIAGAVGVTAVAVPDPMKTTDGLLAVLGLQAQLASPNGKPNQQLVGAMVNLAPSVLSQPADGFRALAQHSPSARPLIATEQEVAAADRGASTPFVIALYPGVPTPALDFPQLRLTSSGQDQAVADATSAFVQQLHTGFAAQQIAAAGLRDPAGDPLSGNALPAGTASVSVTRLPPPPADRIATALKDWAAASRDSRTLVLIDVSGSMGDPAGNGQSKIQLTLAASVTALGFLLPDTSDLGLWIFSKNLTPTSDWQELVPVGPLGGRIGPLSRRDALRQAVTTIPARVNGNTGLYNTALAAYQQANASYDPNKSNSVVLLTDGQNVDPGGIDLPTLLAKLRALRNPAKPVQILTMGIGNQADTSALRQISDATGGLSYTVQNPADIKGVFLDAILRHL